MFELELILDANVRGESQEASVSPLADHRVRFWSTADRSRWRDVLLAIRGDTDFRTSKLGPREGKERGDQGQACSQTAEAALDSNGRQNERRDRFRLLRTRVLDVDGTRIRPRNTRNLGRVGGEDGARAKGGREID